jgi:phosphate starvation-inducible PhoH-like protein
VGAHPAINAETRPFVDLRFDPVDNKRLANLCGQFDEHLNQIEKKLQVTINHRGNVFRIFGNAKAAKVASLTLQSLYGETQKATLTPPRVQIFLQESGMEELLKQHEQTTDKQSGEVTIDLRNKQIKPRGGNQCEYVKRIRDHDINFGIGPAGTGKTYLAVATAVEALEKNRVRRIILARPAVEAGERLGFLPGDMTQKVDPYLRPLYDALFEMMGFETVSKLIEKNIIEIAPLAFMRGRTMNEAFIILDEAQNTTAEQMKMFLTRLGFGAKMIVTGDMTQTDLPNNRRSGLEHVVDILRNVDGISFTFFDQKDVVRHALVQRVVAAYEKADQQNSKSAK